MYFVAWAFSDFQSTLKWNRVGWRPIMMFSATVRFGQRFTSW